MSIEMAMENNHSSYSRNGSHGGHSPDGSSIKQVPFLDSCPPHCFDSSDDVIFSILSPPETTQEDIQTPQVMDAVFLGTCGKTCSDATAKAAINWLIEVSESREGDSNFPEAESAVILGFDTETGVLGGASLVQLCNFGGPGKPGRILVAHKKSNTFATIGAFLAGQADWLGLTFSRTRFICAAAEATGDVLLLLTDANIRMAAVLDLNDFNTESKAGRSPGLRRMLNDAMGANWIKDKHVTCSDWDALPLSLEQLKYASLDAWGSEILGRIATSKAAFKEAYASQDAPNGFLSALPLYSSIQFPRALAVDFSITLNEAQAYQDAGKTSFAVDFDSLVVDEKDSRVTRVFLTSFSKRLRSPPFQSPVEAHITASAGATQIIVGRVETVVGRLAKIRWSQSDAARVRTAFKGCNLSLNTDNFSDVDQSIQKAKEALVKVVKAFKITPLNNSRLSPIQCSSGQEALERLEELPYPVQTVLQSSGIGLGLCLLIGATRRLLQSGGPIKSSFPLKLLNANQKAAVTLGLEKQVSLVRGPPGTGKTSTIAAFAGAIAAGSGRVLIVAPANAATLRVLESIVAQDVRSVALVVSQEWMLEWHQDSVHAHLQPFVVTKEVLDVRRQKARQMFANAKSSSDHKSDLNDRATFKPKSKWDAALESFGEDKAQFSASDVPDIIIMTHGSFISLNAEGGSKRKNTRKNALQKLVSISTVDAVVVDECSQLWKGHAPALFDAFRASTHFVLVGDDRQLPPFGSDAVDDTKKASSSSDEVTAIKPSSKSLFDAARGCSPTVPLTQLNKSYRLTRPVGEILSSAFYGSELEVVRNEDRDCRIRERVRKGFDILAQREPKDSDFARAVVDVSLLGPKATGFIWIHVAGSITKVGKSSANEAEAKVISQIVPQFLCALRKSEQAEGITDGYGSSTAATWVGYSDQQEGLDDTSSEQGSTCSMEETFPLTDKSDFTSNYALSRGAEEDLQTELIDKAVARSREHLKASESGHGQRSRLCVVTPYEGQRARIEEKICDKLRRSMDAKDTLDGGDDMSTWVRASRTVGNVDALQGQEADICVVSAVRAPALGNSTGYGLGFLNDNRRTNVMLSRAQQLLVIVGDAEGWFQGPPGSMLRAFAAKSLEDGTCFGITGSLGESNVLEERPVVGLSSNLVRLEVAHGSAVGIWKSPLPDFVGQINPRQKDRVKYSKKDLAPKTSPKQSAKMPSMTAAAEVGVVGDIGETSDGSLVGGRSLLPKKQQKSSRGSVAARTKSSSRNATPKLSGREKPTQGELVSAMVELSRSSPKNAVPGIVLMKRFPPGTWANISQATKSFNSAGLRLKWRNSNCYAYLPK